MREILFRGKTAWKGEWVYGNYYKREILPSSWERVQNPEIRKFEHLILYCEQKKWDVFNNYQAKVIPETVGQYTGLCDKNGTKIFEGDIVSYTTGKGEVVYRDDYCCFMLKEEEEYFEWIENVKYDCEVIGNIYDNKSLLGGENT